jgi:DNA-directed RNA polymerase specialized sigma24 family protein
MAAPKEPSPKEFLLPSLSQETGGDAAISRKLRRADPVALGSLYETYFPRVYRYFWQRRACAAEIEEATEAAFLAIFEGISRGSYRLPLEHWIFTQVRKVARLSDKSSRRANLLKSGPVCPPPRENFRPE